MSAAPRTAMPSRAAVLVTALCACSSATQEVETGPDSSTPTPDGGEIAPVAQTREDLLARLHAQMKSRTILFGQERFAITGVKPDGTQWFGEAGYDRSDVNTIAGDHPVVMGFDAWDLAIKPQSWTPTGAEHAAAAKHVHDTGGIVEMAFHMHGCTADTFNAGGNEGCLCRVANDDAFARSWLLGEYKKVADAMIANGLDQFPIIFRPLHEHTGNWFWWGEPYWNCSGGKFTGEAAFQRVYRTIVTYMRRRLPNLLVAYSPGADAAVYMHGYPGDEYVDIFGADIYYGSSPSFAQQTIDYRKHLQAMTTLAYQHGKVAALTEIGDTLLAMEPQNRWFTEQLLPLLESPNIDLAYAMTWENRTSGPQQFWVPYPGHPEVDDFRAFVHEPAIALLRDPRPAIEFPVCHSCTADPDGDRWGWEDGKSCRVASWCLVPQYPQCAQCASDPDGDGWGWENQRSCVVDASCS